MAARKHAEATYEFGLRKTSAQYFERRLKETVGNAKHQLKEADVLEVFKQVEAWVKTQDWPYDRAE